jgi:Putative Ig domain.
MGETAMGDVVKLKSFMIVALVVASTPALAQEPHVMWRASGSGTLAVDPLASSGDGSQPPVQPPVVPAPPHLEIAGPHAIVFTVGLQGKIGFSTVNAKGPVSWRLLKGKLPTGMALDLVSGQIIGVPTSGSEGIYVVELMVTDSEGKAAARFIEINVIE